MYKVFLKACLVRVPCDLVLLNKVNTRVVLLKYERGRLGERDLRI